MKIKILNAAVLSVLLLTGCGVDVPEPADELPVQTVSEEATTVTAESADEIQVETTSEEPADSDEMPQTVSEEPASDEPVEYVTMTPPADGWTLEELMSVTYFCDHKLTYPLCLDDLGDDFSLSGMMKNLSKRRLTPLTLEYNGKSFGNATVITINNKDMIYNLVLTPDVCTVEGVEPFVINGVKMNATMVEAEKALGSNYRYKSADSLCYEDKNSGEWVYDLFFENGKLVHLNLSFYFDIEGFREQELTKNN